MVYTNRNNPSTRMHANSGTGHATAPARERLTPFDTATCGITLRCQGLTWFTPQLFRCLRNHMQVGLGGLMVSENGKTTRCRHGSRLCVICRAASGQKPGYTPDTVSSMELHEVLMRPACSSSRPESAPVSKAVLSTWKRSRLSSRVPLILSKFCLLTYPR